MFLDAGLTGGRRHRLLCHSVPPNAHIHGVAWKEEVLEEAGNEEGRPQGGEKPHPAITQPLQSTLGSVKKTEQPGGSPLSSEGPAVLEDQRRAHWKGK